MASNAPDDQDADTLRALLSEISGVESVVLDTEARQVCLIARAAANAAQIRQAALGLTEPYTLFVAHLPETRDHQRIRFVSLQREVQGDQQVRFEVTLEWAGRECTGVGVGETGEALELRAVASATLEAINAMVPEPLGIRLAGVKYLRAFDADLVVISLYRSEGHPKNLVGAVVAGDDGSRAGANAVLNALNRLLGNYLSS